MVRSKVGGLRGGGDGGEGGSSCFFIPMSTLCSGVSNILDFFFFFFCKLKLL